MLQALKLILEIQELDMKMIQLVQLRGIRVKELEKIRGKQRDLKDRVVSKEAEIVELKKTIRLAEGEHQDSLDKIKKLEAQQSSIKKVDEYNALTHELSQVDRERLVREQRLSDAYDKLAVEEENTKNLMKELETVTADSIVHESEVKESIQAINEEGRILKKERDALVSHVDPEIFRIYERLLCNKKTRVVVPLENRCCSGCHIMLTAQHDNLVRRGERLVFCEHCSRIHYWQESADIQEGVAPVKPRRRRAAAKVS